MKTHQMKWVLAACVAWAGLRGTAVAGEPNQQQTATADSEPQLDKTDQALLDKVKAYPRVDGSTSAQPLQVILAARRLGVEYLWGLIWGPGGASERKAMPSKENPRKLPRHSAEFHGMHVPIPASTQPDTRDPYRLLHHKLQHHGTHGSYENLIRGKADLILVARPPSEDETTLAKQTNVDLDVRPVALDAFVFIVNRDNPVGNLSSESIRAIYTGKVTNWKEVGGWDAPLNAYQRNRNSGSQELMKALVMQDTPMADVPEVRIGLSMRGPIHSISDDLDGIGYSVYFYEHRMATNHNIKLIGVDRTYPWYESIRQRTYPYTTEVLVVIRKDLPEDHPARALRDWMLSPDGQAVVRESGYVPIGNEN